jgi:hypothetical protein
MKILSYNITTVIASTMACIGSVVALFFLLPVWTMFIGWIAFFSRGLTFRFAIENLSCLVIGLVLGCIASIAIHSLVPIIGITVALPAVVFGIAIVVVSLRGLPILNNLVCYFLGLVTWFGAHLEPEVSNIMLLSYSGTIGSIAGYIAHKLPQVLTKSVHHKE